MGMVGSRVWRVLSRSIGFVAVVATITSVVARIEVTPTDVTLLSARYVRSIDTAELGIPSPRGVAFQPDGSLLVQGAGATVLRITTGGDLVEVADGSAPVRART